MKKGVLTEGLPRKNGKLNKIDWVKSIGYKVKFIYENIEGYIEIVDYKKDGQILIIKYLDNNIFEITTGNFMKCAFGRLLNVYSKEFKVGIGMVFEDENRNMVITDRFYKEDNRGQKWKYYKYTCNICGWKDGSIQESSLITQKNGCSCCCNRTAVLGINTIWDTDRWMCDLGISEDNAKKYTRSSSEKIEVVCPSCNHKKNITIYHLYQTKSIGCPCSDTFSYPEKFMFSILKQLDLEFETQYSPKYISPKRSDFYLPDYNLVIEVDGRLGHEGGIVHSRSNKTIDESIEVDKWKDEQHLKHGIKTIRIDCFKSDIEYIRDNILKSELNNLFDLSNIDWLKCEKFALSNRVKEVCDIRKNNPNISTTEISKITNISTPCVRDYLKKGYKIGWCHYLAEEEKGKRNMPKAKRLKIIKDGVILGEFESSEELSRKSEEMFGVKLNSSSIRSRCRGNCNQYKGFNFENVIN